VANEEQSNFILLVLLQGFASMGIFTNQSNVTLFDLNNSSKTYWTSHFIVATQHAKHH
jgi:hypothetical protein